MPVHILQSRSELDAVLEMAEQLGYVIDLGDPPYSDRRNYPGDPGTFPYGIVRVWGNFAGLALITATAIALHPPRRLPDGSLSERWTLSIPSAFTARSNTHTT